jgi:Protein of unknown function (DUF3999)
MKTTALAILGLAVLASTARSQTLSSRDFAYSQTATVQHEAAAYRVSLPLAVYQNTFSETLADVRVFNADGVAVPYSLSRAPMQPAVHNLPVPVPMFPLHDGERIQIDGVHLTINSADAAVNLQTQGVSAANPMARRYLLDAREVGTSISSLQLGLPDGAVDYTGRVAVEVSDDLASWRQLVTAVPIANLHANGQTLVETQVEVPPTKANYWRVSWLGSAPGFELANVTMEPAAGLTEPSRDTLEVKGVADPKDLRQYSFDLGAHPPVSRLNVLLPDANSVLDVEISSRSAVTAGWRIICRSGFYRLKTGDAEQQNSAMVISADTDRYWRARIVGAGSVPQSAPRLHVEWIPNELTFLAQGRAPFQLAYGNATASGAETDLNHLPKTLEIAPASLGPSQVSGGPDRLVAKAPSYPPMRAFLWGVLLLAVVVLSWMAYRVSTESTDNRDDHFRP